MDESAIIFSDGQVFSLSDRLAKPERFQAALQELHAQPLGESSTHLKCNCDGPGEKKLYVAKHGQEYRIGRFPGTGHHHSISCRFFSPPSALSGMGHYAKGVVSELHDGAVRVRLSAQFQIKEEADAKATFCEQAASEPLSDGQVDVAANGESRQPVMEQEAASRERQARAMSLAGLLQLLWNNAGMCRWYPSMNGQRWWSVVAFHLLKSSERIQVGGAILKNSLAVVQPEKNDAWLNPAKDRFWRTMDSSISGRKRLLIVGEVQALRPHHDQIEVCLSAGYKYDIALRTTPRTVSSWLRHYREPLAELTTRSVGVRPAVRVIGIFLVNPTRRGNYANCEVVDGAFMRTTPFFMPFFTADEQKLVVHLFNQERTFERLLPYDNKKSRTAPILLMDATPPVVPLDILPGPTDDAEQHRARTAFFEQYFPQSNPWIWNPVVETAVPELPGLRQRSKQTV